MVVAGEEREFKNLKINHGHIENSKTIGNLRNKGRKEFCEKREKKKSCVSRMVINI
jgi:hypothetical protein